MRRYHHADLLAFSTRLLERAGLPRERAKVVAALFLEADLLGYSTHGMQRLPSNAEWLLNGQTRPEGEHEVVRAARSSEVWDAQFLPGPWITAKAVDRACDIAQAEGTGTIAVRQAQHVACLASYLNRAVSRGIMVIMTVSTPEEAAVVPHGGLSRVFSCNPIAAGIPTAEDPILIDTTAAMSALGPLNRAHRLGRKLPVPMIVTQDGQVTDDPASFVAGQGGILPIGGTEQGYKGFALALISEALSTALSGSRRQPLEDGSEANTVFVQAIDPEHFIGRQAFAEEMGRIAALCRASEVAPGQEPVRIPGDRSLARKRDQLANGVGLVDPIVEDIRPWAARLECPFPEPIDA